MKENRWLTLVTCLAYCLDKELWKAIDYLKEQVRVLKEQQEKDKRILLDNRQRMRLATKAKRLTRGLLGQTTVLFTPDTILAWYRKLIAQKYDGSKNRRTPGRPKISQEISDLVIRFKEENPRWGYTRIRDFIVYLGYKIGETTVKNILLEHGYDPEPDLTRKTTWREFLKSHWNMLAACDLFSVELFVKGELVRYMVLFAIELATRKVEIVGVHPQPDGPWMEQIARNVSSEGSFLVGKKYLIHDRDPEPATHGFSVRSSDNVSNENTSTSDQSKPPWTPQWTPASPKMGEMDSCSLPPELAEIVAAWPKLPEHIKAAIRALVGASRTP
jgi:putative transposase